MLVAALAVSQIALSFPLMSFVVVVVAKQTTVSALAGAALFVATGVAADNIFVVHETWAQSAALRVDQSGVASHAARIAWTVTQA